MMSVPVIKLCILLQCAIIPRLVSQVYTVHVSEVIDSLPFLELSESASLFTGVDDYSVLFQFPSPFHFYNESYNSAFISSNGLISFESYYTDYVPSFFPINEVVLSPYWDDIDLSYKGGIHFESYAYDSDDHESEVLLTSLSQFINNLNSEERFGAISAVVIYWLNICPFGREDCVDTNSFQAVLVSSNSTSYAIFTYRCGSLNWVNHNASIGYSAGEEFYANHFLSRANNVNDVACLNEPYSEWSNIVYNTLTGSELQVNITEFGSGSGSGSELQVNITEFGSGSGSGLLPQSCTSSCNPQYQNVEYLMCCNPENFGKFHKIFITGVHRGYFGCPSIAPDWCE